MFRWLVLTLLLTGCAPAVHQARLDPLAEPTSREADAAERVKHRSCGNVVGWLWPGLGPACMGRSAEAVVLGTVGTAELGVGIASLATAPAADGNTFTRGGRFVPQLLAENTWIWSGSRMAFDVQMARRMSYVPQDELTELIVAPFNHRVLRRPGVWIPTLALAAGSSVITVLSVDRDPDARPNVFGARPPRALGYALAGGAGVVLFEHVAIGEESLFRGLIQSSLVRATGSETWGWALGSLIFGAFHVPNIVSLSPEDRVAYLAVGVPWITLTGSLFGLGYRWGGYSLTGPVAMHFWYNLLVAGFAFALNPDESVLAARIGGAW